jgi:hypothetical protein
MENIIAAGNGDGRCARIRGTERMRNRRGDRGQGNVLVSCALPTKPEEVKTASECVLVIAVTFFIPASCCISLHARR